MRQVDEGRVKVNGMRKLPQATVNRDCRAKHPGETLFLPGKHSPYPRTIFDLDLNQVRGKHWFFLSISSLV